MNNTTKPSKTGSIQRQLIFSLLLSLPIIWIAGSIYLKQKLIHEVSEINDIQMIQLSKYLLAFSEEIEATYNSAGSLNNSNQLNNQPAKIFSLSQIIANSNHEEMQFNDESFMGFAVWDSFEFLPEEDGFINDWKMGYFLPPQQHKWRYLYLHNAKNNKVIAMST